MKTLLLFLIALASLPAADLRVLSDLQGGHIRHRSVVGKLTEKEFEDIVSELLGPKEITLGTVVAYGSLDDHLLAGPRGFDHCSYAHWLSMIGAGRGRQPCPEVREASKIGSAIVVRSSGHDCQRGTKLLRSALSPLDFAVEGTRGEILDMSFSRPMGEANEHRIRPELYVQTNGTVTVALAKALLSHIRDLTSVGEISVELRADPWFITECGFPTLYPFGDNRPIPTVEEFARTKYASCGSFEFGHGSVQCFEGHSRP